MPDIDRDAALKPTNRALEELWVLVFLFHKLCRVSSWVLQFVSIQFVSKVKKDTSPPAVNFVSLQRNSTVEILLF